MNKFYLILGTIWNFIRNLPTFLILLLGWLGLWGYLLIQIVYMPPSQEPSTIEGAIAVWMIFLITAVLGILTGYNDL